jgi:flagellar basal body P-ring formation protein FlgA
VVSVWQAFAAWIASALVSAAAAAAAQQPLPVPVAVIYPGEAVDQAAIVDKLFNVPQSAVGNYVLNREQLRGLYAKRPLLPGKPIPLNYLKHKDVVAQGTPTRAVYQGNGFVISTILVPQQAGGAGDIIDARNPQFGTMVKARIADDGSLVVGGP